MAFIKRIGFFLAMNFAIMVVINIIISAFDLQPFMHQSGINYSHLMIFCLLWGMIGSLFSLFTSKFMAKKFMGVKIIDKTSTQYAELVRTVHQFAKKAKLPKMPEVGIYESPDVNAFATGPTRSNSLVAVSTGLLQKMDKDEVEGVLAHEVAHIANGDMVTSTILRGVMNAFVMFLAHIIIFFIDQATRDENGRGGLGGFMRFFVYNFLHFVLGIGAAIVSSYHSRAREFKADEGGARLAGKEKMTKALQKLASQYERLSPQKNTNQQAFQAMQISSKNGLMKLLSTHPPLNKRIEALQKLRVL